MLARLRAQHPAQMMSGVAFNGCSVVCESFNEEAAAHWEILPDCGIRAHICHINLGYRISPPHLEPPDTDLMAAS
jgi:hypothetical protein